ncbi:MAG: hypothetical protein ABIJ03_03125 [Patescibacteria group bacterium]|nr:hypothetical protein [Patescibacteria group bacterium]
MSDQVDLVKLDLEKKILKLIADQIKSRNMTATQAGQIAKMILTGLHKSTSLVEIHALLPKLSNKFTDLKQVLDPVVAEYNLQIKSAVNNKLDKLIEEGKIGQVHDLASKLLVEEQHD